MDTGNLSFVRSNTFDLLCWKFCRWNDAVSLPGTGSEAHFGGVCQTLIAPSVSLNLLVHPRDDFPQLRKRHSRFRGKFLLNDLMRQVGEELSIDFRTVMLFAITPRKKPQGSLWHSSNGISMDRSTNGPTNPSFPGVCSAHVSHISDFAASYLSGESTQARPTTISPEAETWD
jgi:hypothetical protein